MKDRLIVALDVDSLKKAKKLVDVLYPAVRLFKIGSQLFTKEGPGAVRMVRSKRAKVFLDLKFHDIPNTVFNAVKQACAMGVFMTNVHTLGGFDMMCYAVKAKRPKTIILGVTVLTSMDKGALSSVGIYKNPLPEAKRLALLARKSGLNGVVCSGSEIRAIRRACGDRFIIVVPGIRPLHSDTQDQSRVMTPALAISRGADYIVVGRPITQARDPRRAARSILHDINGA